MKRILFLSIILSITYFGLAKNPSVVVVSSDIKHNKLGEIEIETALKSDTFDLTKDKIDVYFCHLKYHIPYYMPSGSIYQDSIKDSECNIKIYPGQVNCYEYDNKKRVAIMKIEGSGVTNVYKFKYDDLDRIIEIKEYYHIDYITYDNEGRLIKVIEEDWNKRKMQLQFYYSD